MDAKKVLATNAQKLLIECELEDGTTATYVGYLNATCGNRGIEVSKKADDLLPDWYFTWGEIVNITEVDDNFTPTA